jgi:hypothetical protein
MEARVIEGTWEEVSIRGHELAGCRVRVVVLDEPGEPVMLDRMLAPLIEAAERLEAQPPPIDGSTSSGAWGEGIAEKFRRQGFVT